MVNLSEISVVILNYNTKALLAQFIPVLKEYSGNAKIIVADNASPDDSISYLKENHPDVQCFQFDDNYGFCGGYNKALALVETRYSVLLNSDIEVTEGWLEPLVKLLNENSQIAACQPKIKSYHQREFFEHAGAAGGYVDFLGYPFCRGRIFHTIEKDNGQYDDNRQIFWATGACMCIRTDLFRNFGGFDTDFFAHMEEIDLCWRWQKSGYQIHYVGESVVYHIGGGTLAYNNPRKIYFNFRNGLYMLFKNLPSSKLFLLTFLRMLLDGIAGIRFLVIGEFRAFMAVLSAHKSFYAALPSLLKKRKAIVGDNEIKNIYQNSLVIDYFISKKKNFKKLKF